jgi:hypothetical protein
MQDEGVGRDRRQARKENDRQRALAPGRARLVEESSVHLISILR